jgi:nucleotide-binding universal stress UspA family protein
MRTHPRLAPTARPDSSAAGTDLPDFTALVVGHDGHHSASQDALLYAIHLARRLNAHVHVIHSITLNDYGIDPDIDAFEDECARNVALERECIAAAFENTVVGWTYHEERGDPAAHLARLAASVNAACIIVGSNRHGVVRGLLGADTVPRRLLHHQLRPVLVVPAHSRHSSAGSTSW